MFEAFSATLSAMLTMFFCIFVGFILRKKKLEPEDTDCVLSNLLNYALAPALTLVAFATPLGLNTVVFPAAYGADTSIGAGMALISHVLSVITFPLMYMLFTAVIH